MWNLRALVRITLLLQGSKWGPQGTAKGKQMENVWWVKKHKRFLCDFWAHLSGSHFCSKDPSWDPKGRLKEWNWEMSDGGKNRNDFYVNFARACQDHTFAARIQVGTPRDSQRNETGKSLMGKKTETTFMWILRAPVRITLLQQGSKLGHQGTAKAMKLGNVWWVKNRNDFYVNFARACQDHTFAARIQVGTPRDSQTNENGKCLMGKQNIHDFYLNHTRHLKARFCATMSESCTKE